MDHLKDMLYDADRNKKFVTFVRYFDGNLWYETECGFLFPVPISDTSGATFSARDEAPLFMRWIRKFMLTV